jgi:hypothetical protein
MTRLTVRVAGKSGICLGTPWAGASFVGLVVSLVFCLSLITLFDWIYLFLADPCKHSKSHSYLLDVVCFFVSSVFPVEIFRNSHLRIH